MSDNEGWNWTAILIPAVIAAGLCFLFFLIRLSALARKGQVFSYTSHDRLREAIEKKLFADLKDIVKITTSTRTPDEDQLRRINDVVNRLVQEQGYCHICANELLKYVGTLLNR